MENEYKVGDVILFMNEPDKIAGRPYIILDIDENIINAIGITSKKIGKGNLFSIKMSPNNWIVNVSSNLIRTFEYDSDEISYFTKDNINCSIFDNDEYLKLIEWLT